MTEQQVSRLLGEFLKAVQDQQTDKCRQVWPELVREDAMEAAAAIRLALLSGNSELAAELLSQASEDQPWLDAARFMLMMVQGNVTAAREYESRALNGGVAPAVIFDFAAQIMEQLEQYDAVLNLHCRALYSDPTEERFEKVLLLLLKIGRLEEMQKVLNELQRVQPEWDMTALQLLRACIAGDRCLAEEKAAALNPEDDSPLTLVARLHAARLLNQDLDDALDALKKKDHSLTDLAAADVLITLGRKDEVVQILDGILVRENAGAQASEQNVLTAGAQIELFRRYLWAGDNEKAAAVLAAGKLDLSMLPPKKQILAKVDLADYMRTTPNGSTNAANQLYDELLAQTGQLLLEMPTETEMYLVRLRCYIGKGEKQKALELAEFAKQISKDDRTRRIIDAMIQ